MTALRQCLTVRSATGYPLACRVLRPRRSTRGLAVLLAATGLVDIALNIFPDVTILGLSLTQVARGVICAFLVVDLLNSTGDTRLAGVFRPLAQPLVIYMAYVSTSAVNGVVQGYCTPQDAVIEVMQCAYWILFTGAIARRWRANTRPVALAVILSGIMFASTIMWVYLFGGWSTHYGDQVNASFGVFGSAKGIAPMLLCAVVLSLVYIRGITRAVVAGALMLSVLVTYNRTAEICLGLLAVLYAASLFSSKRSDRGKVGVVATLILAIGVFVASGGIEAIAQRWHDWGTEQAGAGRKALYKETFAYLSQASLQDVLIGRGTRASALVGQRLYGPQSVIHTHSDFCDTVVEGGIVGIVAILGLYLLPFRLGVRPRKMLSRGNLPLTAVLLTFVVSSALTGVLGGPSVMTFFGAATTVLLIVSREQRAVHEMY